MELIGYGEDAITFWVLTNRLDKILERFDDNSKESECCVYYRPSFGRGGKSRSLLGEFDAVLITPKCTYLIESKWEGSKELSTHELSKGQKKRHDMFTLIARAWDKKGALEDFVGSQVLQNTFKEHYKKELPKPGSGVYLRMKNILEKSIEKSATHQINIENLVLILLRSGVKYEGLSTDGKFDGFPALIVHYDPIDSSNFFMMNKE